MADYPTDLTGLPSSRKVLLRLKDVLELASAMLAPEHDASGVQIVIDRPYEEPFTASELNAGIISIRLVDTPRQPWAHNAILHAGEFMFDIGTADGGVNSIGARGAAIEAWLVNVLHADISLGGLTHDAESRAVTANEEQGAEAGILLSAARIQWITPRTDLFTIWGAIGPVS